MALIENLDYKIMAVAYFVATFVLIGISIVALVQGIMSQAGANLVGALLYYAATPLLIMASYMTFHKGYYKLRVLAMARK
ncbi:MAG: hypothetical protein JW744_03910 [Candidatus Diapherotrites archaeon]|uniref:Uncharacterized protein n=1 Tax=Candidatus Iainarchaeum sp. TaxID=3101447 RepID=A0A938YRI6_9ARCH|nr:hypothetical protein [Candidatus Diapherotrites archaeon]